ncbi:MAG: hypothetical protein WCY75_08910 [Sulfurimonadaceae bacterium]
MKKRVYGRNPSQIINNFYTLATIVIMTAVITLYSKYIHPQKEQNFTPAVLPCQTAFQITQKISNDKRLDEAWRLFEQGNYMFDGGLLLHENSLVPKRFSLEYINAFFENSTQVVAVKNAQKFLNIKYEMIENESVNPLQHFELLVSFRISAIEVFRMYTYLDINNDKEISQKVECIMNSFKQNAKQ